MAVMSLAKGLSLFLLIFLYCFSIYSVTNLCSSLKYLFSSTLDLICSSFYWLKVKTFLIDFIGLFFIIVYIMLHLSQKTEKRYIVV